MFHYRDGMGLQKVNFQEVGSSILKTPRNSLSESRENLLQRGFYDSRIEHNVLCRNKK